MVCHASVSRSDSRNYHANQTQLYATVFRTIDAKVLVPRPSSEISLKKDSTQCHERRPM